MAVAQPAFAQSGSTGGSLGKQGKSVSGGAGNATSPRTVAPSPQRSAPSCPSIAGTWNSWASGMFGKGDTTFGRDGSATHRSGINGKWWCENGELRMQWAGGVENHTLSADRKTITRSDGAVGFRR
jgi:hypothetical protein